MTLKPEEMRRIARDLDQLAAERAKGARTAQQTLVSVDKPVTNYLINRMIRSADACQKASEYLREQAKELEAGR